LLVGDRRRAEDFEERLAEVVGQGQGLEGRGGRRRRGRGDRPVVGRAEVDDGVDGDIDDDLALERHPGPAAGDDLADDGRVEVPLGEDLLDGGDVLRRRHHEHPLLGLRQQDLVGRHAGLALGDLVEVDVDAHAALGRHLGRRAGQAGRAHVLDADDEAAVHDLEAGLEEELLLERVADLDVRPLVLGLPAELGRGHGGAVDAVAAGLGAEIDDRQADAGGLGVKNLVLLGDADGHGVDQIVAVVARMESDPAADGRYAEGIAVAADAGDDAGNQRARPRVRRRAETQEVQARDRACAHGEDVAQNSTDTVADPDRAR
jgi:hypothetical protein